MIAELGYFALTLAFMVALVQAIVPLAGAARGDHRMMALSRPAAFVQFGCVAVAFAALTHAFVVSDFSVINVAQNSHSAKPMLYKLSGVWGNHEGSMLLWVLILTLFGAAVAACGGNLPASLRARVLAVHAMIGAAFLAFIVFTSNPFLRLDPPPLDGNGLNPLLQDPGLAFHPPFLYLGYVGFSMAFSFAVAALIEGRVDPAWARWVRPWTLAAWAALTLGIALGSWWAYYELGWGGFWFWDPVENASFMPWLIGTALLHSAIVVEKRDALKSWTILLAIIAFALSLIGTFLVRSGVLTSVHAFAVDPARGSFILAILVVAVGGSLGLYALRAPQLKAGGLFAPASRESALILNNLLLSVAALTVFIGTLYPLFLDAISGAKVSVGPPFFNATFLPLMAPLFLALPAGPLIAWKRGDIAEALRRLRFAAVAAAGAALGTFYLLDGRSLLALGGLALAAWLVFGALAELGYRIGGGRLPLAHALARARGLPRAAWGMALAHGGLGLAVAGIVVSQVWQIERVVLMRAGDRLEIAGYMLAFQGVTRVAGPNYRAERGAFDVMRDERIVTTLHPEKRVYPVGGATTTEAAILTTGFADLYVVLGEADAPGAGQPLNRPQAAIAGPDAAWAVRAYWNPLVPWIWFGAVIMFLGGIVSLFDRRYRVGAPAPARARGPAAIAAE
ncbi:MAG TPA: heme lyase CcmF/NrfE family subunit [Alphaproteobacteria bacterium]|nr:heme lyase CcmF/NrfE family subunit [Alphaproteobacteria bacterium]